MANIVNNTTILAYLGLTGGPTSDQAVVGTIQPWVEQAVERFLGWQVQQQTFTNEYYPRRQDTRIMDGLIDVAPFDSSGGRLIQLLGDSRDGNVIAVDHVPLRSVTSLYFNPSGWLTSGTYQRDAGTQLFEGQDFQVDWDTDGISNSGIIYRTASSWYVAPFTQRTVQISYVAGYTAAEIQTLFPDILLAVCEAMMFEFKQAKLQQREGISTNWQTGGGGDARDRAALKQLYQLPANVMRRLEPFVRMSNFLIH